MADQSKQLATTVKTAFANKTPLCIQGTQSKEFLRQTTKGEPLSLLEHNGIVAYEPTELVVTVRAGTSIDVLQTTLAEHNQSLAFDPPRFKQSGTIGGAVATGLSGPARPWVGAVRDHVLGTKIINGKGEILKFGGQVMKNVAGYDASRLMVGAYGGLGILLDISIKVLPIAEQTVTLTFEGTADEAIKLANQWSGQTLPLTGIYWVENRITVRLSGTEAGMKAAINKLGSERLDTDATCWQKLRDHQHVFFKDTSCWRLSLPPATPMLALKGEWLIDWGGAQRWLKTTESADKVQQLTAELGGHAEHWHGANNNYLRQPLQPTMQRYHQNLKDAFDPQRILNPGAFYADL